jgi:hypothetical protein
MISSDNDLVKTAEQAGTCLEAIQTYLKRESNPKGKVKFPRGFIRTAASIRDNLPATRNPKYEGWLRENISYDLITVDVFRWLLVRTDLTGVARQMLIKKSMSIFANVCDSLMQDFLYQKPGPKNTYKERTKRLRELGVIDDERKEGLDWLWDKRCNEHLSNAKSRELDRYQTSDYCRARKAYEALVTTLRERDI